MSPELAVVIAQVLEGKLPLSRGLMKLRSADDKRALMNIAQSKKLTGRTLRSDRARKGWSVGGLDQEATDPGALEDTRKRQTKRPTGKYNEPLDAEKSMPDYLQLLKAKVSAKKHGGSLQRSLHALADNIGLSKAVGDSPQTVEGADVRRRRRKRQEVELPTPAAAGKNRNLTLVETHGSVEIHKVDHAQKTHYTVSQVNGPKLDDHPDLKTARAHAKVFAEGATRKSMSTTWESAMNVQLGRRSPLRPKDAQTTFNSQFGAPTPARSQDVQKSIDEQIKKARFARRVGDVSWHTDEHLK